METLKLFRSSYIEELKRNVLEGKSLDLYVREEFPYEKIEVKQSAKVCLSTPKLKNPEGRRRFDFENSKLIFEAYKGLSPTEATDVRFWTYLSHTTYWDYMRKVRPVENEPEDKRSDFIITHWFIRSLSTANLLRHEISLLWWVAYLTYDQNRSNPYELTEEAFSMLDYTRHLLPERIGWNRPFARSFLDFVVENPVLFSSHKQERVRFLIRECNYIAGYKVLTGLTEESIKKFLNSHKKKVEDVIG